MTENEIPNTDQRGHDGPADDYEDNELHEDQDEELMAELDALRRERGELDDDQDDEEPSYEEWVAAQIGPREVGGRYRARHGGPAYTVLAIEAGPRADWPTWQITVQFDDRAEPVSHCTGWDERDVVLAEPDDAAMAAEVAEIMRESLAFAEDIRHLPDGTRILPQYLDDRL